MELQENIRLAPLTTLGVGGRARFFVRAFSPGDAEAAVEFAERQNLPLFVLGGGSNVLISDQGWPGLVLAIAIRGIQEESSGSTTLFRVGAGENWDAWVEHAVARNCAGVECLSGIPGSVGGTPIQNVGAYGQEVSETIVSVAAFDRCQKCVRHLSASECGFGYRTSAFNTAQRDRFLILRVTYGLRPGGAPRLRYADLERYFRGRDGAPTLSEVRDAVCKIRARKGMLITAGDPDSRSAGSFFKNPVLTADEHADLIRKAGERNLEAPSYPARSQQNKISAAWLVENSGFRKGYRQGGVGISSKHALALVNRGTATAAEIIGLKDEIQKRVQAVWGIRLEAEPVLVGF